MFDLKRCKYDFPTDTINIFLFLYDCSGSMSRYRNSIREANQDFYNDFKNFEEKGSVAIAQYYFSDSVKDSNFSSIEDFDTSYYAEGSTKLYYAIQKSIKDILAYRLEIRQRTNIEPRITFLVFTDGEDDHYNNEILIEKTVTEMKKLKEKELDVTTVFVAFDKAIQRKDGETLGFDCIEEVTNIEILKELLGENLSNSCREQSKSANGLGSKFFSKVNKDNENQEVEDVIDDDEFFDI